jgi:rSAM/selenodomain-associated transferase 2
MKISVIIPTLNEAANLLQTLGCVHQAEVMSASGVLTSKQLTPSHTPRSTLEVIVADGGSQDQTIAIAETAGAIVVQSPPSRVNQLNTGAQKATGEIFLFLHADTQLPPNWQQLVIQTLQNPQTIAGAFELAIASDRPGIRLVEWGVQQRSRWCQLPYGDQAIFLRAETFKQLGGFPNLSIMEDFQFIKRLQPLGKIAIVPAKVTTAGRRWEKLGVGKTTLLNQIVILGFYLGISPDRLRTWYRGQVVQPSQCSQISHPSQPSQQSRPANSQGQTR